MVLEWEVVQVRRSNLVNRQRADDGSACSKRSGPEGRGHSTAAAWLRRDLWRRLRPNHLDDIEDSDSESIH